MEKEQTHLREVKNISDDLNVIVKLGGQYFAIPASNVITIDLLRDIRPVPDMRPSMRGLNTWRDRVFPVLDLRHILGMKTYQQEMKDLADNLQKRKQDHINWLHELETSIKEGSEFKLQKDAKLCEFGKWYQQFSTEDVGLRKILKQFASPHSAIHGIADVLLSEAAAGRRREALNRLNDIRESELGQMLNLFDQVDKVLRTNVSELFIFVHLPETGEEFGLTVDSVAGVKPIATIDQLPQVEGPNARYAKFVESIGQVQGTTGFVLLLNMEKIFKQS